MHHTLDDWSVSVLMILLHHLTIDCIWPFGMQLIIIWWFADYIIIICVHTWFWYMCILWMCAEIKFWSIIIRCIEWYYISAAMRTKLKKKKQSKFQAPFLSESKYTTEPLCNFVEIQRKYLWMIFELSFVLLSPLSICNFCFSMRSCAFNLPLHPIPKTFSVHTKKTLFPRAIMEMDLKKKKNNSEFADGVCEWTSYKCNHVIMHSW